MKYFLDTEFIEMPSTIDLISIGIVREDGKELYLINGDCNLDHASDWVTQNVLKKMPEYHQFLNSFILPCRDDKVMDRKQLALYVYNFIKEDIQPQFWGYFCDYDWVVFCWLFGRMINLPKGWPMFCMDLAQFVCTALNDHNTNVDDKLKSLGVPENVGSHNALEDAKWIKMAYETVVKSFG